MKVKIFLNEGQIDAIILTRLEDDIEMQEAYLSRSAMKDDRKYAKRILKAAKVMREHYQ